MEYNTARPKITLPPDVYDTYEFAVTAYKGIGGGQNSTGHWGKGKPVCQMGFRDFLLGSPAFGGHYDHEDGMTLNLGIYGVTVPLNDEIVQAVNARKGRKKKNARITWAEYCAEGNIHRGEAEDVAA